jgi:hypothetical protein
MMGRFWDKVHRRRRWDWTAGTSADGYGKLKVGGKWLYAHRVAWEITHGPIPAGLLVLHRCDRRRCCNPAHLFLGTVQDNTDDMLRKGRWIQLPRHGERNGRAKLGWADVLTIRDLYRTGEHSQRQLAQRFGVAPRTIGDVVTGKKWRQS